MALLKENASHLQVTWTNTASRVGGFIFLIGVNEDRIPERGCGEEKWKIPVPFPNGFDNNHKIILKIMSLTESVLVSTHNVTVSVTL